MLVCEAFVDTDRAQRYVDQLAKHFVHQPGGILEQSQGDGQLLVDFGWGTCSMRGVSSGYHPCPRPEFRSSEVVWTRVCGV